MKISTWAFIVIMVVILLLGGVCGFILNPVINPNSVQVAQKDVESKNNIEETKKEEVQYDGSKNILVGGKKYTISYLSEEIGKKKQDNIEGLLENSENEYVYYTGIKLYLNGEKIKDVVKFINLGNIKNYDIQAYSICKDYIAVTLKIERDGHTDVNTTYTDIYIFDQAGREIRKLEHNTQTVISEKATQKQLTYDIDESGITIYSAERNARGEIYAAKTKYTVENYEIKEEIVKTYNSNEVDFAGEMI